MTIQDWLGKDNSIGIKIWTNKYQYKEYAEQENGELALVYEESFEEWLDRVSASKISVRNMILNKQFLFGGRILANRGLPDKGIKTTYSNCYVLKIEDDSIESIYDCCSKIARTYSYGGGVGIDISILRPKGAKVNNSAKFTTGAVSFMKTYDIVTETIGQQGRRGALMISIDVRHPDVEDFIQIKANTDQINNANISVRVNDEFMKAVENDEEYVLRYPCDFEVSDKEKDILELNKFYSIETQSGMVYLKKIKAKNLFMQLVKNNWDYAEPGILYWDRISNWNMLSADETFEYAGTNPCKRLKCRA